MVPWDVSLREQNTQMLHYRLLEDILVNNLTDVRELKNMLMLSYVGKKIVNYDQKKGWKEI